MTGDGAADGWLRDTSQCDKHPDDGRDERLTGGGAAASRKSTRAERKIVRSYIHRVRTNEEAARAISCYVDGGKVTNNQENRYKGWRATRVCCGVLNTWLSLASTAASQAFLHQTNNHLCAEERLG